MCCCEKFTHDFGCKRADLRFGFFGLWDTRELKRPRRKGLEDIASVRRHGNQKTPELIAPDWSVRLLIEPLGNGARRNIGHPRLKRGSEPAQVERDVVDVDLAQPQLSSPLEETLYALCYGERSDLVIMPPGVLFRGVEERTCFLKRFCCGNLTSNGL
jgi:hypothetical protein